MESESLTASDTGLACEILRKEEDGNYLAKLWRK
jgi:hypothetical protein